MALWFRRIGCVVFYLWFLLYRVLWGNSEDCLGVRYLGELFVLCVCVRGCDVVTFVMCVNVDMS